MTYDLNPEHVETCARCDERPTVHQLGDNYGKVINGAWVKLPNRIRLVCSCGCHTKWHASEHMAVVYWNHNQIKTKKKLN